MHRAALNIFLPPLAGLALLGLAGLGWAGELRGTVWLLGEKDGATRRPAAGAEISVPGLSDPVRSGNGGEFSIPLPDGLKAGEEIAVQAEYLGYRLFEPAGGRVKLAGDGAGLEVQLLPVGSRRFLADAQIAALIQAAAALKPQPQDGDAVDFSLYLRRWARSHGLDEQTALAEIRRWAKQVRADSADPVQLGLAAFAEQQFAAAEALYLRAGQEQAGQLRDLQRQVEALTLATVDAYRKAGDAAHFDRRYDDALANYQAALAYVSADSHPRLWAEVSVQAALTQWALGADTQGAESARLLALASETFERVLAVLGRSLPAQGRAKKQDDLGKALQEHFALRSLVAAQPAGFKVDWTFAGVSHLIDTDSHLQAERGRLQVLFAAVQAGHRDAILQGLDALQANAFK